MEKKTLQECVVRGLYDSMDGFLAPKATTLPSLVIISVVEEDILSFLIYYMTSCDHVIRESLDFIMSFASPYVSALPSLAKKYFWRKKYLILNLSRDQVVRGTCDFMGAFTLP